MVLPRGGGGVRGGSCHEVTIVNFQFHESRNKNSLVLNSLRSLEKSNHSAVKFSYEPNFRHSRFISYLFTIHSQGLKIAFHVSRNTLQSRFTEQIFLIIKSQFTEHKKTGSWCHENTLAPLLLMISCTSYACLLNQVVNVFFSTGLRSS